MKNYLLLIVGIVGYYYGIKKLETLFKAVGSIYAFYIMKHASYISLKQDNQ